MFILKKRQKGHPTPFYIDAIPHLAARIGDEESMAKKFETRDEAEAELKRHAAFMRDFEVVKLGGGQ